MCTNAPGFRLRLPTIALRWGTISGVKRRVLILGSTGSIGTQALEVIAAAAADFEVVGLAAGGSNLDLLVNQARATGVSTVAVGRADVRAALQEALPGVEILAGPDAATEIVDSVDCDVVLNGVVGSLGLGPTLATLRKGATLALANKESLVAGGALVLEAAAPGQIVPVDSEHSAMAQSLLAGESSEVSSLILTASGGPFFGKTRDELWDVTPADAGRHPTWNMGPLITLNSATLVNKALELIEAHLLFGVAYEDIVVTVHRQSVVHSAVTFVDGATVAKASPPSMKLPIALSLDWPRRIPGASTPLDFSTAHTWTFEPVDTVAFPAIEIARAAGIAGGQRTAVFNAANEEAAPAFWAGQIRFPDIVDIIGETVEAADQWATAPRDIDDVLAAEDWARAHARELIASRGR